MTRRRPTSVRRWPFWLLIAAWLCANTPQTAMIGFFGWVKGAEHFSHQVKLRQEVAAALAGNASAPAPQVATAPVAPKPTPLPALPFADTTLKKIDLATTGGDPPLRVPSFAVGWPCHLSALPPGHVADVPHPPPRAAVAA